MARVLVAGMLNLETSLRVERFPLDYFPVTYPFHGVTTCVSGSGWNVAAALAGLGHEVRLLALVGDDEPGRWARREVRARGVDDLGVVDGLAATCQTVVLVDGDGRRQVHTDLKDAQGGAVSFPDDVVEQALDGVDLAVVGGLDVNRPLLPRLREAGISVACDVHVLRELAPQYDVDFLEAADILALSDEGAAGEDAGFLDALGDRYPATHVLLGRGVKGASVRVRRGDDVTLVDDEAWAGRGVVSTVGAGDALLAGYLHGLLTGEDPRAALRLATTVAGWTVGRAGASVGHPTVDELGSLLDERTRTSVDG